MAAQSPPEIAGAQHRTVTIVTADAGPLDLHVVEAGSGPPLLMLHGWPQHAACWRHVIPGLAESRRLICPDLRGFGWSGVPAGGYDPVTFAADAVALLDALEIERADVIGHDWGGFTALVLALREPERVDRVLALGTVTPWPARTARALRSAWRGWYALPMAALGGRLLRARSEAIAARIRADARGGMAAADAASYLERLGLPERQHVTRQLYRSYLRTALGAGRDRSPYAGMRLTRPTWLMLGARDSAIAPALLEGSERHADDLTIEIVPDCGHFIPEERPDLVLDRARSLFAEAT